MTFLGEVGTRFRPFAVVLAVDALEATSLWAVLAAFRWLTGVVPVREKAGQVISIIHSIGVVVVFAILAGSLVVDVIRLKRAER